jgi:hypothetical protein
MSAEPCDERRLIAFLAGELDEAHTAAFDAHLLGCEGCWTAVVEDRRGRRAAAALREEAPAALLEGVRQALDTGSRGRNRGRRLRLAGAVLAAAVAVGTVSYAAVRSPGQGDPDPVAAVVRLANSGSAALSGTGSLRLWRAPGPSAVIVAESPAPFPMPADAGTATVGVSQVWIARRGRVRLLCVMAPRHVLLAGPVPEAELVSVARAYGLAN